jgi:hypothetical protein
MTADQKRRKEKPKPGEKVILKALPPGFFDQHVSGELIRRQESWLRRPLNTMEASRGNTTLQEQVKPGQIIFYRLNRLKLTLAGGLVKQREGIPIHLDSLLSLFIEED